MLGCSIDYGEFLAATVNLSQLEKEETMFKAFQFFDKDNSGYITKDELEESLRVRLQRLHASSLRLRCTHPAWRGAQGPLFLGA